MLTAIAVAICLIIAAVGALAYVTRGTLYERRLAAFNREFADLSFDARQDLMSLMIAKRRVIEATSAAALAGRDYMPAYRKTVEAEAANFRRLGRADLAKSFAEEAVYSTDMFDPAAKRMVLKLAIERGKNLRGVTPSPLIVEALNIKR